MLKKQDMKPGVRVRVVALNDGVQGFGPDTKGACVSLKLESGGAFGHCRQLNVGDELEVLEPPKRRNDINEAKVELVGTGMVGYIYWCSMRASCTKV